MPTEFERKPSLVLDLKKQRLRIHKITLRMLANPEYIQILINPKEKHLLILTGDRNDHLAHKINYEKLKTDCYELYSQELIHAINSIVPQLQPKTSYMLPGEIVSRHNLARFQLTEAKEIRKPMNPKEHNIYVH